MKKLVRSAICLLLCSVILLGGLLPCVPAFADSASATAVISSGELEAVVDTAFPRVLEYHMNGKTLYGQEDTLSQIKINEQVYTPQVTSVKASENVMQYTMRVDGVGTIQAELAIDGHVLSFRVTGIEETQAKVYRFEIPNHSLVSIRTTQEGAAETGVDVRGVYSYNDTSTEERNILTDKAVDSAPVNKSYLFLNTDDLAVALNSNAMNTYAWGTSTENRNIESQNETRLVYQTQDKGSYKKMGAWSFPWTYRETETEIMELPEIQVSIVEDVNGNGTVNWQDAAIAGRDIIRIPLMSEDSTKSFFHIAYTRASLAQWPFARTLDMVKKLYLYTDGFGQFLQYKGYQAEGHDSNHPDYGDSFNEKVGGLEELNLLATEALKYNCKVGVHLNHTEAYPEAKNYTYDLVTKSNGWDSLDLAKIIDRYKDATNEEAGGLAYRLQQLKEAVPDLQWIYYDVYSAQGYAEWKLAQETMRAFAENNGMAIGTEYQGALEQYSIWNHIQSHASPALRLMKYNITDQFFYDPIMLESRHAGSMGYGDDGNQDQGTIGQTIDDQIDMFYTNNLLFKYMQNHDVDETKLYGEDQRAYDEVRFENGLMGKIITERGRTLSGSKGETRQPVVELAKDGRLVARYQKHFSGEDIFNGGNSGSKRITPMLTQYLLEWDTELDDPVAPEGTKLYHYNSEGGETAWELPASWKDCTEVQLYRLTDTGRADQVTLPVKNGTVRINAEAGVPYIVCRAENTVAKTVDDMEFGEGTLIADPGFDRRDFAKWNVSNPEAAAILTSGSGETYVSLTDGTVTQNVTGLKVGTTYQLSVWAEACGSPVQLFVENGGQRVTNQIDRSDIPNNYYNSLRYTDYGNKMQRLKLEFTATAQDAVIGVGVLSGNGSIEFDDFRLIEKKGTGFEQEAPEGALFFCDFEMLNDEGWGPFVPAQYIGRAHLSETHLGYTNDTIQGKYSLKLRDSVGSSNTGEVVRTIPSNMKLENGKTYTVQFDYWMKTKNAYTVGVRTGSVPTKPMMAPDAGSIFADLLDYEETRYSKTFTVPNDGNEYGLSFIKNITGKEELIVDNIVLYEGEKPLPELPEPTYDFETSTGDWQTAYGGGTAEVKADGEKGVLVLSADRQTNIMYDRATNDIQDGSIEFDLFAPESYSAGAAVRYTDSKNYLAIRFVSESDGWRYISMVDGEEKNGIINMPGVTLQAGRNHHVEFAFTGDHYRLVVDGIPLFDGEIPGLCNQAGRIGLLAANKSVVEVDNIRITGEQAATGTEITQEIGDDTLENYPGHMEAYTWEDSFVRNGDWGNMNFGRESTMMVKNDGTGYTRQAYLKFPVPNAIPESIKMATVRLYLDSVGTTAGTENLYAVENDWTEETITANNAPKIDGAEVIGSFDPQVSQDGFVTLDVTDYVKACMEKGEQYFSFAIHHAQELSNTSDITIAAYEYEDSAKRPLVTVEYDETATGILLNPISLDLEPGKTFQLTACKIPDDIDAVYQWESANNAVATVDENGLVTAVGNGNTTITVSSEGASAVCNITVRSLESVTLSPDADTYSNDGDKANVNLGTESVLRVKNAQAGYNRKIFMSFDLTGLSVDVLTEATLRLYICEMNVWGSPGKVVLKEVTDSWEENTLTHNNMPQGGDPIGEYSIYMDQPNNAYYDFDLTAYIKDAIVNGKTRISFLIENLNGITTCGFGANSREAVDNQPQLVITGKSVAIAEPEAADQPSESDSSSTESGSSSESSTSGTESSASSDASSDSTASSSGSDASSGAESGPASSAPEESNSNAEPAASSSAGNAGSGAPDSGETGASASTGTAEASSPAAAAAEAPVTEAQSVSAS